MNSEIRALSKRHIIKRFESLLSPEDLEIFDPLSFEMDLASIEEEVDWEKLKGFDDFNFLHDCYGIINNMQRDHFPGKLGNCFVPRCAKATNQ